MKRIALGLFLSGLLGGCLWDVGKDPQGKRLQTRAETVIVAIKAYREKYGVVPERLELLTPEFMAAPPEGIHFNPFSGVVVFSYQPSWPMPGMNAACSTHIDHIQWHCVGAM